MIQSKILKKRKTRSKEPPCEPSYVLDTLTNIDTLKNVVIQRKITEVLSTGKKQIENIGPYSILPNDPILFFESAKLKKPLPVPPPTPNYDLDCTIQPKRVELSNANLKRLPQVSSCGIKFTIAALGQQLGYDEYEYDLVQFWLLDMLTDCLWKAQDAFHFEETQQKMILEWVVAIFKLIADPDLDLSRKNFLRLFKNIIIAINQHIAHISDKFPSTSIIDSHVNQLLQETRQDEEVESEDDSSSTSSSESEDVRSQSTFSFNEHDKEKITICPEFNIQEHINYLKTHNPVAGHSLSDDYYPPESIQGSIEEGPGSTLDYLLLDEDLTEPPSQQSVSGQFQPLDPVCGCQLSPSRIYCLCKDDYMIPGEEHVNDDYYNLFVPPLKPEWNEQQQEEEEPLLIKSTSQRAVHYLSKLKETKSEVLTNANQDDLVRPLPKKAYEIHVDDSNAELGEYLEESEILKEWAQFNLMQQRNSDMDNPNIGWVPWESWLQAAQPQTQENITSPNVTSQSQLKKKSLEEIREYDAPTRELNYLILQAIVDFTFDYFYENFHFAIIKFAFRYPPTIKRQTINKEWPIPKVIKQQFKPPKPAKVKKDKKEKPKKAPPKKSDKAGKSSKDKKSKTPSKASKKESTKKGKPKEGKKDKKKEKPKPTPEELARLEEERVERERLEEEARKRDENRVYMFPLADAASETLFMSIFENWVKASERHSTGKKGKDKKSKKEKK